MQLSAFCVIPHRVPSLLSDQMTLHGFIFLNNNNGFNLFLGDTELSQPERLASIVDYISFTRHWVLNSCTVVHCYTVMVTLNIESIACMKRSSFLRRLCCAGLELVRL